MAKRRTKRAEFRAKKKARKEAGMGKPSGKSRYGKKHALQARGVYRATSPFEAGEAPAICAAFEIVHVPEHWANDVDEDGNRIKVHVRARNKDCVCTLRPRHMGDHLDEHEKLSWAQAGRLVEAAA